MTEKGWPWDSIDGDRPFAAQQIADACKSVVGNGVVGKTDFEVSVQSASTVSIGEGEAWINGRYINYGGGDTLPIPYGPSSGDGNLYGLIVLKCETSVTIRGFSFFFRIPYSQDASEGPGEIAIAKVRYSRGTPNVSASDVIRCTYLATPINGSANVGEPSNIGGLIMGQNGELKQAVPGVDYLPMSGGNLSGDLSVSGNILTHITSETKTTSTKYDTMPGTHIVRYSDGRMTYCLAVDDLRISTTCVQSGQHTVFVADGNYYFDVSNFETIDNVNVSLIGGGDLRFSTELIGMTNTTHPRVMIRNIEAHYWGGTSHSVGDTNIFLCGALIYVDGWWK